MKIIILLFLSAHLLAAATNTYPTLTLGTNTYSHVTVRNLNPREVIIRFDGGLTKLSVTNLPENIRAQFYDPDEFDRSAIVETEARARDTRLTGAARYQQGENFRAANFRVVDGQLVPNARFKKGGVGYVQTVYRSGSCLLVQLFETRVQYGQFQYAHNSHAAIGGGAGAPRSRSVVGTTEEVTGYIYLRNYARREDYHAGAKIAFTSAQFGTTNISGQTYPLHDCGLPYIPNSSLKMTP